MSLGFWPLMVKKDTYIIKLINFILSVKSKINFVEKRKLNSSDYVIPGDSMFIILNGPSIKTQNLLKLAGQNIMFSNRGFMHKDYKELSPKFHVFIDPKLVTGEWDVVWLDEIVKLVPDIIFVMPVEWSLLDRFKPYIDKGYRFLWIKMKNRLDCTGVSGACFETARILGFKKIYFTGFDANGLAHEMLKSAESHFYGQNDENNIKTTVDFTRDLYMFSRHLNDLNDLAKEYKKNGIKIINLTNGGLLDMFVRDDFDKI